MNCKPNELAVVTRTEPNGNDYGTDVIGRLQGRIVRVLTLLPDGVWTIETPIIVDNVPCGPFGFSMQVAVHGIGDCYLTPLRGDPLSEDTTQGVDAGVHA